MAWGSIIYLHFEEELPPNILSSFHDSLARFNYNPGSRETLWKIIASAKDTTQ